MQGKKSVKSKSKGDSKLYIFSGLITCIMFFTWFVFYKKDVFINYSIILFLLFVPSSVLSGLFYIAKDLIRIFTTGMKKNASSSFSLLEFIFVTLAFGNFLIAVFLVCNSVFAEKETKEVRLEPTYLGVSHSKRGASSFVEVTYDNVSKRIYFGTRPLDTMYGTKLNLKVSRGYFGYYIMRGHRLE